MESIVDTQVDDTDFNVNGSSFPNEFVNPSVKERRAYGVQYAKSMYNANGRYGGYGFWTDEEFQALTDISQGRQSIDKIRNMFNYFKPDQNSNAADDGSDNLAYLDIQVLNLAPKYINRAVDKMMNLQYDVQMEAIDPVSVHEKKTYEASIQAFYEFKKWLIDIKMSPRDFFPDLDVDILPEYPDELMFEMLTNPKIQKAVDGELALTLIHQINDFNQKMRMVANDKVTYGRGHIHCYRDENGIPREDRINPKYFIGSYVENENYEGQEYAGFLDFPTVNQFRKEAKADLTDDEIEAIVRKYAQENNISTSYNLLRPWQQFDGLNYIPVMRFYFLSQDDRVYLKRKNNFGNETLMERGLNWKPNPDDPKMVDKEYEVIQNSYTSVYGGTWILDSDLVYNYGRKAYPRSNLVDVTLPIKTFSPNYKDGRTVSFVAQMIEPLFMINVAWNKIKETLAKGWMGIQEVDFTQLESVALGKGGKSWTPRQVYEHFLKTGRLIKRSPTNKYDQKYSNSAVSNNPAGVQLSDYMNTLTLAINMLEQQTGTTAAEAFQTPDRLAVGVMEQSQVTGDLDMGYLFNSFTYMYRTVSEQMLLLVQEAKRDGVGIEGFIPALGRHFIIPDTIAHCDYGLFLVRAPSPQEWLDFYASLNIGLEKGTLTHLDVAYIREIKNLKKARQILGIRVKINERKANQLMAANNQAAMDANRVAAADKTEGELAIINAKGEWKLKEIEANLMGQDAILTKEKAFDARIADKSDRTKKDIAQQTSRDEIVKQAVRNKPEYEKARAKAEKPPAKSK